MSPGVKTFLQRWAINTLAVLVSTYLVRGIHYEKGIDLFVASLLLGILNAFFRPLLLFLSLPLLIFTLGLFTLVINAILLLAVGWVLKPHFYVEGFWSAFWGALTISIISILLNSLLGLSGSRVQVKQQPPPSPPPKDDGGPVIDV